MLEQGHLCVIELMEDLQKLPEPEPMRCPG